MIKQKRTNAGLNNASVVMQIALILFAIRSNDITKLLKLIRSNNFVVSVIWLYLPTHFLFSQVDQPKYDALPNYHYLVNVC